nr:unnamed protein product [Digitaria exilis]
MLVEEPILNLEGRVEAELHGSPVRLASAARAVGCSERKRKRSSLWWEGCGCMAADEAAASHKKLGLRMDGDCLWVGPRAVDPSARQLANAICQYMKARSKVWTNT